LKVFNVVYRLDFEEAARVAEAEEVAVGVAALAVERVEVLGEAVRASVVAAEEELVLAAEAPALVVEAPALVVEVVVQQVLVAAGEVPALELVLEQELA
jgi:hypothetical protein